MPALETETPETLTEPVPAVPPPAAQEQAPGRLWRAAVGAVDAEGNAVAHIELAATDLETAREDVRREQVEHASVLAAVRSRFVNSASSAIWNAWAICDYHSTATHLTTSTEAVWNAWNRIGTSATTCGCTSVIDTVTWQTWNAGQGPRQMAYRAAPTIEATPEQKAKWEAERVARNVETRRLEEERAAREKQLAVEKAEADKRARKLLLECVSPEQRDSIEKHGWFDVKLPNGNTYRIHKGRSHNVKRVRADGTVDPRTFCAHPADLVPDYDTMLAQKFMLETDEAGFVRMANRG